MIPMITLMLLVPALALALIAALDHYFSRKIAIASTAIGFLLTLAVLAISMAEHGVNVAETYPYIGSMMIGLSFRINVISLALLLMSSVVLLAAVVAGNPENERQKLSCALIVMIQIASVGLFTSANLFLFFVFWEIGIIAMFFMINVLGSANRRKASMNFLIYETFASALLLLGILLLYFAIPMHTFDMQYIIANASHIPQQAQGLIFLVLFLAFMTNMPLFPMHFWLPDAHTEASTQGSMILSGILTKFGAFGMLMLFTMLPISAKYAPYIVAIAAISAFYSVLVLMKQTDLKKIAAYSTIVEMGIIMVGIGSLNIFGTYGSVYAMLAHGLGVALLFLVVGCLKYTFGERDIRVLRGTVVESKFATYSFLVATAAATGLPLTAGFVADILIFMGSVQAFGAYGIIPLIALILLGAYLYFVVNRSMLSSREHSTAVNYVGTDQHIGYLILAFSLFVFGVMPFIILNLVRL